MISRLMALALSLAFAAQVQAVEKKIIPPQKEDWTKWSAPTFNEQDTMALNKDWPVNNKDRKLASAQEFNEGNLKPDVVAFRKAYLATTTADQLEALLTKAEANWNTASPDLKYFTANFLVIRPLRGIIWRMRPLFETGNLFSGNRSTHAASVHLMRQMASGVDLFFPTAQWTAGFAYLTEPSKELTKADQFHSVRDFQRFLTTKFIPALQTAARRSSSLLVASQVPTFVWDRQIVYGTASFADSTKRYVGFGPAEIYFSTSLLYRGMHDALVFSAYNQDDLINIMGRIGKRFGIDSALQEADMGMTAEQRVGIISTSVHQTGFLQLQDYKGSKFGTDAMAAAYKALLTSVQDQKHAYDYIKGGGNTDGYVFNSVLFQPQTVPRLERAMNNMVAAVSGVADIRDPVTGDVVQLNLQNFYTQPYPNLSVLMATGFNKKSPAEETLVNNAGETLSYRNFLYGSENAWDNKSWAKIVPSAGQAASADYMKNAKRVIFYSLGTPLVAGQVDLFVR